MKRQLSQFSDPTLTGGALILVLITGALLDLASVIYVSGASAGTVAPGGAWARIHVVVRLLTMVMFLIWIDRTYGNVISFGQITSHHRAWATMSLFVPPMFLFRPFQIVDETWRLSSYEEDSNSRFPILLWWMSFLAAPIVIVAFGIGQDVPIERRSAVASFANVFNIVSAVALMYVVASINRRQVFTAEVLAGMDEPERPVPVLIPGVPAGSELAAARLRQVAAQESLTAPLKIAARAAAVRAAKAGVSIAGTAAESVSGWVSGTRERPGASTWSTLLAMISSTTARQWARIMAFALGVAALLMLCSAASLGFHDDVRRLLGIAYLAGGLMTGALARILTRIDPRDGAVRWRSLAFFTVGLSVLNLISIAGVLGW